MSDTLSNAFREVKKYVCRTADDYKHNVRAHYQICNGFSELSRCWQDERNGLSLSTIASARQIITERLAGYGTVNDYLERAPELKQLPEARRYRELTDQIWIDAAKAIQTGIHVERANIAQSFRHAWLDALAAEYE